jgi:plasmid stability protein
MSTLTIKNLPPELYERLKQSAERNRRSLNREIIVCLEKALLERPRDTEEILKRVTALRKQLRVRPLTEEILRQAKNEGRP